MRMCMPINGRRHCFDVPELADKTNFKPVPPGNYAELSLAATVISLVDHVTPQTHDKEFTKALTDVCNRYVQTVKEGLPKGVELNPANVMQKAA